MRSMKVMKQSSKKITIREEIEREVDVDDIAGLIEQYERQIIQLERMRSAFDKKIMDAKGELETLRKLAKEVIFDGSDTDDESGVKQS